MKIRKLAFGFLILALLSCNYVTQMIIPPTATAIPTSTPAPTETPVPSPTTVALVPAYIPPQCATVPLATIAPEVIAQVTPEVHPNADISKREQLSILEQVGDIVKTTYVYPDFNGKNWTEIVASYRAKIEAGLSADEFYLEMQKMIEELGDEHSFYLSPLEVQASEEELKGESQYVGVGIYGNFD